MSRSLRLRVVAALAATAVVAALAFAAAGSAGYKAQPLVIKGELIASAALWAQAKQEGVLNAYFSYPNGIMSKVVAQFTADTGVKVNLTSLASNVLAERVQTEWGAKQLNADVLSFSERATMQSFLTNGILTPYKVPLFKQIPASLKNGQGYYTAETRIVIGLAFNKLYIKGKDIPRSWLALLNPKWKGKIGMTTALTGGVGWTAAMFEREHFGLGYWTKLAAQQPFEATGVGQLTNALTTGQIWLAVDHLGTLRAAALAGAPLGFYFPREGTPTVIESLGVVSTAAHPAAARLYENWVMSKYGQHVFTNLSGEYGVYPDIVGPGMPKSTRAALWYPTLHDYLSLRTKWLAEWQKVFNYVP